jgi:hypothetical protein
MNNDNYQVTSTAAHKDYPVGARIATLVVFNLWSGMFSHGVMALLLNTTERDNLNAMFN